MKRQESPRQGRDLHRPGSSSPGARALLGLLVAAFLADCVVHEHLICKALGIHLPLRGQAWRLLTYSFLHYHPVPLLVNSAILWLVARRLEEKWGTLRFLAYWLCCAVGTGLVALAAARYAGQPYVGASGAAIGLLLPYGMLYGRRKVAAGLRGVTLAVALGACALIASLQGEDPVEALACSGGLLVGALWLRVEPRARRWSKTVDRRRRIRNRQELVRIRAQVDRLLEKIHRKGMASLTRVELSFLRKASRRYADALPEETSSPLVP